MSNKMYMLYANNSWHVVVIQSMLTILLLIINYITCSYFEGKNGANVGEGIEYKRQTRQVNISNWHLKYEGT